MSLHINSKQPRIKVGEHKGEEMFVMKVNHYSTLYAEKVIPYASETCRIPKGVMRASWEAIGSIITSWVLEGHIVEIPGLGYIRADMRVVARADAKDFSADDIFRRKLLLTPTKDIKNALNATPVSITCYDTRGYKVDCL